VSIFQGGLKAVIWTDVFQCVVMFAGFFAVLIKVKRGHVSWLARKLV